MNRRLYSNPSLTIISDSKEIYKKVLFLCSIIDNMRNRNEERIVRRQTTWHAINIKARRNQNSAHYVHAFRRLQEEDPLVELSRNRCESLKTVTYSEILDEDSVPHWIKVTLLAYTMIDPEAFYNRRSREDITMEDWDSDVVANKKEVELIFIPSVHILAVKKSSEISLNSVVKYLSEALNRIEPDGFDVSVIVERDILDRILTAHAIMRIEASVSYSNPGHTKGFQQTFETKLRGMGANRFSVIAQGTTEHPLVDEEDGMIQAVVNLAEQNGTVKATIQATENARLENIDSNEHPRVIVVPQIINNIYSTLYNELKTIFGHNN